MMTTRFIENYVSSCFEPKVTIHDTYMERKILDYCIPGMPLDLMDAQEVEK